MIVRKVLNVVNVLWRRLEVVFHYNLSLIQLVQISVSPTYYAATVSCYGG